MLRVLLPLIVLVLPGCAPSAATVTVFGRAVPDLVYSGVTGRDCSVVRLEEGKTYCMPVEPPPAAPPLCTHSLGIVDCWSNPEALNDSPMRGVADGPSTLTPEQEVDRTAKWPKL